MTLTAWVDSVPAEVLVARYWWVILAVGCTSYPNGVGSSQGTLQLEDGPVHLDGGAITYDWVYSEETAEQPVHVVVLTDESRGFTCVSELTYEGPEEPRPERFMEAYWQSDAPDRILISEGTGSFLGLGGSAVGTIAEIEATLEFDDTEQTVGTITTPVGDLTFDAVDCGIRDER